MKVRSAISAALTMILAVGAVFANADQAAPAAAAPQSALTTESTSVKEMKSILFKLVRQDEYLDEAIDTLDSANGKLSIHDISALGLSLKMIKGNLDVISALNKKQFTEVQPDPALNTYSKTIFSYSRQVSQKVLKVTGLVAEIALKNKKSAMRDAVSSKKGKKTRNGKKLIQILEGQKAMDQLSADIKTLKTSSSKLTATSKWLYIVSK
ncbi:MAG: hypothetical protein A2270_05525 [Elusimicrobia bacterium RIFOXYA12_FULL_51_18]|nr:MAG: hypothetical protein A2270_05525 [Elusimicrobia bacterium RIFOXYA12_FULL_51_18]